MLAVWLAVANVTLASDVPQGSELQEIVVTGERIARSIRETASSVAIIAADAIADHAGSDRLDQLLDAIPNLQLGSGGIGPTIRGQDSTGVLRDLPAFLGGSRPRTTMQLDGRAVSYNEFAFAAASIWDVKRIEVFRSPQSTTQGRNSIAGAIFVETEDPTFDLEGCGRVLVGDRLARQLSAVVSGPLIANQLALRVAGDARRGRTSSELVSSAPGIDPNRDDFDLLRVKLRWEPTLIPGARIDVAFQHNSSQAPQIEGIRVPFEARRDPFATYGIFTIGVDSLTIRGRYPIGASLDLRGALSAGQADITRHAPSGFGQTRVNARDRSMESILDWHPGGILSALGGVHYSQAVLQQSIDLTAAQLGRGAFEDLQRSVGVFSELTWHLSPRLTFATGLRFQHDSQDRSGTLRAGNSVRLDYRRGFDAWLPKFSASFDYTPTMRVGMLIQRASNPGGTSINLRTRAPDEFDAESLWDFELFARNTWAEGKVALRANAFYYNMRDTQLPQNRAIPTPGGTVYFSEIDNAPRTRSNGLEIELSWNGDRRLAAQAALGLLDTRIIRTLSRVDPLFGKQFQRSPKLSASASLAWHPVEVLDLSAQVRYHRAYFSDDTNTPERAIDSAAIIDARAAWRFGAVTAIAYVRNLLNSFQLTYRFGPSPPSPELATAVPSRECGFGLEARF